MATTITPPTESNVKEIFLNESPAVPAANADVKYEVKKVSRTVKTVEGETKTSQYVLVPVALTIAGMTAICEDKLETALKYFNEGYFSSIRTKTSNELSGGSEADKAFAKLLKIVKNLPMFAGKSDEEISVIMRDNPGLMSMFATK